MGPPGNWAVSIQTNKQLQVKLFHYKQRAFKGLQLLLFSSPLRVRKGRCSSLHLQCSVHFINIREGWEESHFVLTLQFWFCFLSNVLVGPQRLDFVNQDYWRACGKGFAFFLSGKQRVIKLFRKFCQGCTKNHGLISFFSDFNTLVDYFNEQQGNCCLRMVASPNWRHRDLQCES